MKTLFDVYQKNRPASYSSRAFNQRLSFQFPTQCTGSQNSSMRIFQFRYHKFGLTFINRQDIIIDSFLDRLEDIITGLSQSTEQNNCLRTGESNEVCKSLTQNSTGKVKNILRQLITLDGCIIYILRGDVFGRNGTLTNSVRYVQ